MTSHHRIGVVIAAYEAEQWLPETLSSLQAQSHQEWLCVVVDDGSTDSTPRLSSDIAATDKRFRALRQSNSGVSAARNAGLAALPADVDKVLFLDADDLLLPEALNKLSSGLADRPDAVGVHGWASSIDAHGQPMVPDEHPAKQRWRLRASGTETLVALPLSADSDLAALTIYGCLWPPATCLMRRSVLGAVGGFDMSLTTQEDWDLTLRMAMHGPFAFLDEEVAKYRQHERSATRATQRNLLDKAKVRERARTLSATGPASDGGTWHAVHAHSAKRERRQAVQALGTGHPREAWRCFVTSVYCARRGSTTQLASDEHVARVEACINKQIRALQLAVDRPSK